MSSRTAAVLLALLCALLFASVAVPWGAAKSTQSLALPPCDPLGDCLTP